MTEMQKVKGSVGDYFFHIYMNFSRYTTYSYLNDLAGLTPVSTADGVTWFIPQYYDYSDAEVRQGTALSGMLKDFDEFYQAVKAIAPTFGGINLEDIAAPRCFEIEKKLKEEWSYEKTNIQPGYDKT